MKKANKASKNLGSAFFLVILKYLKINIRITIGEI